MVKQNRLDNGTFAPKSSERREVRTLRVTDKTWQVLGGIAQSMDITRADLFEELVASGAIEQWGSVKNEIEHLKKELQELAVEKESLTRQITTLRNKKVEYFQPRLFD
jgi:archaellum component FlaC